MNYLTIAGHLGADPEVRFTSSGKKVTTLRVAAKARGGADLTVWWRVSIWGEQYDKMVSFLKKGSGVMVFGEMHKPEIFNDKEGKPQVSMNMTATDIQFSPFGRPAEREGGHSSNHQQHQEQAQPAFAGSPRQDTAMPKMPSSPQGMTMDDEVPF
ncbi:MAG TPA: single-stranded DNA-binding protein [Chlamydiales bacterium]|jgi:single-strand DNA-binding protein